MIRMFNRNSNPETLVTQIGELKTNLVKSGYQKEKLEEIEYELRQGGLNNDNNIESHNENKITFPLYYFDGLKEFKQLVYQLKSDLKLIIGDVKIVFATKKGRSVGNTVIRNKNLSMTPSNINSDQKCNTNGCMQCPLVVTTSTVNVNNKTIKLPSGLNCKTSNAIYLWVCKICREENSYFGRTVQKCHKRTNGHRGCFNNGHLERSALSMHASEKHPNNISLDNFNIAIVKKVSPQNIKREEFRVIDKYRTKCLGLNRYNTHI